MIATTAAILGAAALGAGANIAAASSNAGAAKSAAASNAAEIAATRDQNAGLIDAQQQQNTGILTDAGQQAQDQITNGAGAANDIYRFFGDANQQRLNETRDQQIATANDFNGRNQANADTLSSQGQGLFQGNVDRGNAAGDAINKLLGIGGDASAQEAAFSNWLGSTGYKFTLQQGSDAVSSNAATRGLLNSGGTLKALNDYGQSTAQTYFGNYLNGLQTQQGTGLSAANALSGVYSNVASLKNNSNTNAANALANAYGNYSTDSNANSNNMAAALGGLATNSGTQRANLITGTAGNVAGLNTSSTNALVGGNAAASNALVGNTNNALGQTISSNNSAANAVSGLAGNLATGYGYSQGMSSYGGAPNALGAKPPVYGSSYTPPSIQVGGL